MKLGSKFKIVGLLCLAGAIFSTSLPTYASITYTDSNGKKVETDEFLDVTTHWARSIIREWYEIGIVSGDEKGCFNPNAYITRADIACILDRLLGLQSTAINNFSDLSATKYYTSAVLRMNAAGLLSGDGKSLRPLDNTTREEFASIMVRAFKLDTDGMDGSTGFIDDYNISSWAKSSVKTMTSLGYIHGTTDGKFEPKRAITRAEVVAILDNMVETYYSKVKDYTGGGASKEYTNNARGNAFISTGGLVVKQSTIGGNLYFNYASKGSTTLEGTTVQGDIVVLGDGVKLEVTDNSDVGRIECYGVTTLTGADNFSTIYVDRYASGTSLDVVPKKITLAPLTSVKIKGTEFKNESKTNNLTYTQNQLKNLMSEDSNTVEGGPEISKSTLTISYDNIVKVSDITVKTKGTTDIDEIGVIWNKGTTSPSLDDYDGKEEYSGYNTTDIGFTVNTQKDNDFFTYRVYAINEDGLVGYSNATTLRSYDFEIEMKLSQVGSDLRPELHITGDSVPTISTVGFKYDYTHIYTEGKSTVSGKEDSTVSANNDYDYQQYRYTGTIKVSDDAGIPPFYGYKIVFKDAGTIDKFPVLSNITPESIKPVSSITTGTGKMSNGYFYVDDSKIVTNFTDIQEYGVVYRYSNLDYVGTPDATSDNWSVVKKGTSIANKSTKKYDANFKVTGTNRNIYYAAYVKTANGYYYGDLKSLTNTNSTGDIGSPEIGNVSLVRLDGGTALLTIEYESDGSLDTSVFGGINSFNDMLGNVVTRYNGASLNSATPWISLGKNKVVLTFEDLRDGYAYEGSLQLTNNAGNSRVIDFEIPATTVVVSPIVDTSSNSFDKFGINTYVGDTMLDVVSVSLDGTALSVSGNNRTGYTAITKQKLAEGTYPMTIKYDYHISKEQSNLKSLRFERTVYVTIN